MTASMEQIDLAVKIPHGELEARVSIPTDFIPISSIVPVLRELGEKAQSMEVTHSQKMGHTISCQKGCSACCQRFMVPVSPPEAFALTEVLDHLPDEHRMRVKSRLATVLQRLKESNVFPTLLELGESPRQQSEEDLDSINRDYYALGVPCVFLENDVCSIYEHRPAACREFLVSSPAELCQDMVNNPIQQLPVPLRGGTVLSILWSDLMGGPVRLIPLPLAFAWADRHRSLQDRKWKGAELFDKALESLGKFLNQVMAPVSRETQEAGGQQ